MKKGKRRRRRSKNQDDEGKFFFLYFTLQKLNEKVNSKKLSRCSSWDVYHKLNNKNPKKKKGMTDFIKITAQYHFSRTKKSTAHVQITRNKK